LKGRTIFHKWGIRNIVGNDVLHCKPDLKTLSNILPEVSNCNPELFPALILLFWLSDKRDCKCPKKKKKLSCACNCGVLIFDTGKIVIAGCRDMSSIIYVRDTIRDIFNDVKFRENEETILKFQGHSRFQARREKIIEFVGWKKNNHALPKKDLTITSILKNLKKSKKRTREEISDDSMLHPFVVACKNNQIENVEFITSFDRTHVQEALDYARENGLQYSAKINKILLDPFYLTNLSLCCHFFFNNSFLQCFQHLS